MRRAQLLADGLYFGEGPRWRDGRLWFSDFYDHAVKTVDMEGRVRTVLSVPGRPSGLGWLPDGRLLVVSMVDRRVLRLEPEGLVDHADLSSIATFHTNDMVVDGRGRAYVGNFGFDLDAEIAEHGTSRLLEGPGPVTAALARVDPDGSTHVAAAGLRFPNGMAISPDGRTLVVAETFGPCLTAYDVGEDGTLTGRRVWADMAGYAPDGICLDAAGCVWVADATAPRCVRVAEGGEVLDGVETDRPCFACMLGGPDRRHLFVLAAARSDARSASLERTGRVLIAEVEVPGAGLP